MTEPAFDHSTYLLNKNANQPGFSLLTLPAVIGPRAGNVPHSPAQGSCWGARGEELQSAKPIGVRSVPLCTEHGGLAF